MKIKNLELYYVVELTISTAVSKTMTACFEEAMTEKKIMKKGTKEGVYFDLEKSRNYKVTNELGVARIENEDSIEPLENYYTIFGLPKLSKTSININKKVKKGK